MKRVLSIAALLACLAASAQQPSTGPQSGVRYATDAYPGFDFADSSVKPTKKEPGLFSWWSGPKRDTPAEQLGWCVEQLRSASWGAARRGLDALVRAWPASAEAPRAQKALADLLLRHYLDYGAAFAEYRYLLDFYSMQCDYDAVAAQMYKVANLMRQEGKTVVFFRFANTVEVRQAYEALVLRAPGAEFVPDAMLAIAELREEDGELEEAVAVYENLRNLHASTDQARTALYREARARMELLRRHEYNRDRCRDTIEFLRRAEENGSGVEGREDFAAWRAEAVAMIEDEAFGAAKFYDSRTRTRRSAISAYETFVRDYPASIHVPEALERIQALKGGE